MEWSTVANLELWIKLNKLKKCKNKIFNAAGKDITDEQKEEQIEEEIEKITAKLNEKLAVARQTSDQARGRVEQVLQVMDATVINPVVVQKFSTSERTKKFKCDECQQGWARLEGKTGRVCPVLDTFKALCYVCYAVEVDDDEDNLVPVPVKFGLTGCGLESLRFLSLVADYKAHSVLGQNGDLEYVRKVDTAFEQFKKLHLTFVEFGEQHRGELSADESLKRVKNAEAVCIKACDRRDLLTNAASKAIVTR